MPFDIKGSTSVDTATDKALIGRKFTQINRFTASSSTPLYILYEVPEDSEYTVDLIRRFFKTYSDGADMVISWYYDVSNASKTQLPVFNENTEYVDSTFPVLEVSVLNPVDRDETTGVYSITGQADVTDIGTIRDTGFIAGSGVGRNTSGDVDNESGFRRYTSNKGFLVKITSESNNNDILFGYTWIEDPE